MRYVLDASVAVAAARPAEPGHAASLARTSRVLAGEDEIVVPAIFPVEIASALVRGGVAAVAIETYIASLLVHAELVVIGGRAASRIQGVALRSRLRAADALYAWVAEREAVPFVTLDREVHARAASFATSKIPDGGRGHASKRHRRQSARPQEGAQLSRKPSRRACYLNSSLST